MGHSSVPESSGVNTSGSAKVIGAAAEPDRNRLLEPASSTAGPPLGRRGSVASGPSVFFRVRRGERARTRRRCRRWPRKARRRTAGENENRRRENGREHRNGSRRHVMVLPKRYPPQRHRPTAKPASTDLSRQGAAHNRSGSHSAWHETRHGGWHGTISVQGGRR